MKSLPLLRVVLVSYALGLLLISFGNTYGQPAPKPSPPTFPAGLVPCNLKDPVQRRIYYEYGAIYRSSAAIKIPNCLLNENDLELWSKKITKAENKLELGKFYLQPEAKAALEEVIAQMPGGLKDIARNCNTGYTLRLSKAALAKRIKENCTSGINNDWAFRTFSETKINWQLRKPLIAKKAVEDNYSKKVKPKIFSYAIPGASQHHFGLAIDVNDGTNYGDKKICGADCTQLLNSKGWYRTVRYDPFHFTFLGYKNEIELINKGLQRVDCRGIEYWVPNPPPKAHYKEFTNWKCDVK